MMRVFLADLSPFTWWLSCAPWTRTRAYAVSAVCGLEPGALVPYRVSVEVAEGHADFPVADFDVSNFVAVLVVFDAYDFALAVEAGCEVVYVCVGWDVLRVVHVVIIGAVRPTPTSSGKFLVFLCALPGLEPGRMPSALFCFSGRCSDCVLQDVLK